MSDPTGRHIGMPAAMNVAWREHAKVFECEGERLIGIITAPEHPIETGVVIIVGGPQYRAGSHRQFTLLARQLAEHGIASFRFDYRGMGDSEGDFRNFEAIDEDIRAAIEAFIAHAPSIEKVVLWGLCDAASAALYYGHTDRRVTGMVLLNPWVHTEAGAARARLTHYYLARLLSKAFWSKLFSRKVALGKALGDLAVSTLRATAGSVEAPLAHSGDPRHGSAGYIGRMLAGARLFRGNIQVMLSGNDLTAQEFCNLLSTNRDWGRLFTSPRVGITRFPEANHTFSSRGWRDRVAIVTSHWIQGIY